MEKKKRGEREKERARKRAEKKREKEGKQHGGHGPQSRPTYSSCEILLLPYEAMRQGVGSCACVCVCVYVFLGRRGSDPTNRVLTPPRAALTTIKSRI